MDDAALLKAAKELAPQVAAASDQIDRERRLPEPLVAALVKADLFRMLVPRSMGGSEASLPTLIDVIQEIAKADGSTAWCLNQAAVGAMISAALPPDAARNIFGRPDAIPAWGPGAGTALPAEGGYRITGEWSFASGCRHATWLGGNCALLGGGGEPKLEPDGTPQRCMMLFPAGEAEFRDMWDVSGLRGTASDTYQVSDLFVPADRAVPFRNAHVYEPGPLYLFRGDVFSTGYPIGFASVALGLARSALDAFLELASTKTPRLLTEPLCDQAVVQMDVGLAEARLRSSEAFLRQAVNDAWDTGTRTRTFPQAQRMLIRLSATHAIQCSAEVVDMVYQAAGATAIFTSNAFERRWRDVHAVTQQFQGRREHYRTAGRFFLGADLQGVVF